jgi:protoheme IX farnesyltransferase
VFPLQQLTVFYGAIAVVLGIQFLVKAWQLKQAPGDRDLAKGLFKFSIFYLMLLCLAMVIDSLPVTHQFMTQLGSLFLP